MGLTVVDRIRRSRDDAAQLRGQRLSEVTPSRRDFAQYVAAGRDAPAIVARIARQSTGSTREELTAAARAADDAEVAAISVSLFDDLTAADLATVSAAVGAPILRVDPLVHRDQLYHSRLHGSDAVVLPVEHLGPAELPALVDIAVSMHMSVVLECNDASAADTALRWPYTIIGLQDLHVARSVTRQIPLNRTIVLLSTIATRDEYEAARGLCDAVVAVSNLQGLRA
jgi:indole-3-glycerol phosphate synthase